MRLCKMTKVNMMIAILLCMAFVVNIGTTVSLINYKLNVSSINVNTPSTSTNTFVEFASVSQSKGEFEYSPGTYNNQLSVNYGFSGSNKYDLMIKFTAQYEDTETNNSLNISNTGATNASSTHLANDFTINIVNRDKWCVDMGTIEGWKTVNESLVKDGKKYYTTGSTTSTLTGVMYYMDTLTGSGSLPVISGVTFHTSLNNSFIYLGDKLSITLTPVWVKSNDSGYTSSHSFSAHAMDSDAFKNWYQYMAIKSGKTVAGWASRTMIYNSYVDEKRSLMFPYDTSIMTTQVENGVEKTVLDTTFKKEQPNYSNTAYRYEIDAVNGTAYDAITAGNRYNGGLGVYVIPDTNIRTISVSFSYSWYNCKTKQFAGSANSLMINKEYSSEIQTISTAQGDYRYYKGEIDTPIYIDILEYIRISAEGNKDIINGGYNLLLTDISIGIVTNNNMQTDQRGSSYNWTGSYQRPSYQIHNSTQDAPILARATHVVSSSKKYDANVAITNNGSTPISINGFTVSSKLWYGYYANASATFEEMLMDIGYLSKLVTNGGTETTLKYNTSLWKISNYSNGVFTFALVDSSHSVYIPAGYTLTLIDGVEIPMTSSCQNGTVANDFWCTLEVSLSASNVSNTVNYSRTSSSSVEVITKGYYTAINNANSNNAGKIYIRNNTSQVITGVAISNLDVRVINDDSKLISRDKATANTANVNRTDHLTGSVSIKPGEMVLAYTITPTTANENAIILEFNVTVTLATTKVGSSFVAENSDIDLSYNEVSKIGNIINNSNKYYEFRLISTVILSNQILSNSSDFVYKQSGNVYHYYYKGVICPHRSIEVFEGFAPNVVVDYLEHNSSANENYYIDDNYSGWNLSESNSSDIEWLNFMKNLYQSPTVDERKQAIVIS